MEKINLNENEMMFAPQDGKPGYIINGIWYPVNPNELNSPRLKRDLERYARLRGKEQLKRDQEKLRQSSLSQNTDNKSGSETITPYNEPPVSGKPYNPNKSPRKSTTEPADPTPPTPPTSTPKNLTPQQRAYGPGSTLSKAQQDANLAYDRKRYETDDKGNPIIGKLRTAPGAQRDARNFGLKKNIENFPNQRVFVRPDEEPKKSATDKTSSGAGSYAAYQQNVLKNLGTDYGRLPQTGKYKTFIKPVAKRTMQTNSYAYDLVLDYLLSEGHVDTVEEAHYVMLQMTSEHVQQVVEERTAADPKMKARMGHSNPAINGKPVRYPEGHPKAGEFMSLNKAETDGVNEYRKASKKAGRKIYADEPLPKN